MVTTVLYEMSRDEGHDSDMPCVLYECGNCKDWRVHYYGYVPKYCCECGAKFACVKVKKWDENSESYYKAVKE